MANSGGFITPAVTMPTDIANVLGISGNYLDAICTSNAINIWAKFKPIYHSTHDFLTNAQRQNNGHSVSGYSISWGVMKPTSWDWRDYIDYNTGQVKSGKWGWDKPVGGSSCPFRLGDFLEYDNNGNRTGRGYYHYAKCPIAFHFSNSDTIEVPKSHTYPGSVLSFLFTFQNGVQGWDSRYCLALSEIFSNELDCYPTVIMTCYNNGRLYEYAKSGENTIRYYTGNVNPYVQVLVDTHDLCEAMTHDGASYDWGPITDGAVWTCCMVLTSLRVEGSTSSHTVYSGSIRRLEYEDGADRRDLTVVTTTPLDDVTALSYTVTIKKASNGVSYYIDSVSVTITTNGNGTLYLTVDGAMTCLTGTIGGTGWSGSQQQETRTSWSYLTVNKGRTVTTSLNADMPYFNFTGDIGPGSRVAAGSITFKVGISSLQGSFGINVYGGASSYSQTVTIK